MSTTPAPGRPQSPATPTRDKVRPSPYPAPDAKPNNPWAEHLRGLIGKPIEAFIVIGDGKMHQVSGRCIAVDLSHGFVAIEADKMVVTIRNLAWIASPRRSS